MGQALANSVSFKVMASVLSVSSVFQEIMQCEFDLKHTFRKIVRRTAGTGSEASKFLILHVLLKQ